MNCESHRGRYSYSLFSHCVYCPYTGVTDLKECVEGAKHVQECVFEDLEVKKKVG